MPSLTVCPICNASATGPVSRQMRTILSNRRRNEVITFPHSLFRNTTCVLCDEFSVVAGKRASRRNEELLSAVLLPGYCRHNRARPAIIAMFAEVDSLPGAEKQSALTDRDCQTACDQRRFDVGRHVVGDFEHVFVVMRPLGNEFAKMPLQIATHFRTHALVYGKRSRRVLNEQVQYADFDLAYLRELRHDFIGDYVKATAEGFQSDDALNPEHEEIIAYRVDLAAKGDIHEAFIHRNWTCHPAALADLLRRPDSYCWRRSGRLRAPPSEHDEHGGPEEVLWRHARRHHGHDRLR